MSVRAWNLQKSEQTPWYLWLIALVVATIGGILIAEPKTVVLLIGTIGICLAVRSMFIRPINGILVTLCILPEYTLFRGICELYSVPLPMAVIGMWPELILLLMLVSLIITACKTGVRLCLTWFDLPVLFLFLSEFYGVVLSLLEKDGRATMYGFHSSLTPLCFYFLVRWLHHSPKDLPRIVRYWLIGFVLLAVASIYDFIFRPDFIIRVAIKVRDQFWGQFDPHTFFRWYPRMQSLLFAEQIWGTLCSLVMIFCMVRLGQPALPIRGDRNMRRFLWIVLALALFGLIFSMSRGAYICAVVATMVLLCFRGGHRRILAIGATLSVVTLLVAFSLFGKTERVNWVVKRTASLADSKSELAYERVNQWSRALKAFPLFPAGRGIGKAGGQAMYHGTGDGFDFVADGGYFRILAEQGLPGLLFFFFGSTGLIWVLSYIVRRIPTGSPERPWLNEDRALSLTILACFCGLLIQNIGGNIFDSYFLSHLFWLLAGFVVGRYTAGISSKGSV